MIAGRDFEFANDDTPDTPTELYSVLKMVCINPKCPNYGGKDLNKATKFETVRNKVK